MQFKVKQTRVAVKEGSDILEPANLVNVNVLAIMFAWFSMFEFMFSCTI